MANVKLEEKYRCSDDCVQSGCPKHLATLEYFSVTNTYLFDNGKGVAHHFEDSELEVMISLLKKLKLRREDSIKINSV